MQTFAEAKKLKGLVKILKITIFETPGFFLKKRKTAPQYANQTILNTSIKPIELTGTQLHF